MQSVISTERGAVADVLRREDRSVPVPGGVCLPVRVSAVSPSDTEGRDLTAHRAPFPDSPVRGRTAPLTAGAGTVRFDAARLAERRGAARRLDRPDAGPKAGRGPVRDDRWTRFRMTMTASEPECPPLQPATPHATLPLPAHAAGVGLRIAAAGRVLAASVIASVVGSPFGIARTAPLTPNLAHECLRCGATL